MSASENRTPSAVRRMRLYAREISSRFGPRVTEEPGASRVPIATSARPARPVGGNPSRKPTISREIGALQPRCPAIDAPAGLIGPGGGRLLAGTVSSNAQREQCNRADPEHQDHQRNGVIIEPMPTLDTHDAPHPV